MEILRNIALKGADKKSFHIDVYFTINSFYKPVVIFNHGFKGFKDWGTWDLLARRFAEEGFVFIKFNQSHNGIGGKDLTEFSDLESFGKNTYSHELKDIEQVLNWVENNNSLPLDLIDKTKINLLGHSRGGSTVILAANRFDNISKVASWAAFKDIAERFGTPQYAGWREKETSYIENGRTGQKMPQEYVIYEDYEAHKEDFNIEAAAKSLNIPQLIVHGTEDATVLFHDALAIRSWNKDSELFLVPNADHVFGGSHPYNEEALPVYMERAADETIRFFKA